MANRWIKYIISSFEKVKDWEKEEGFIFG